MLFQVHASSPGVLMAVMATVLAAATLASVLSARGGIRAEPWAALRSE
jgi:hypothetical protein